MSNSMNSAVPTKQFDRFEPNRDQFVVPPTELSDLSQFPSFPIGAVSKPSLTKTTSTMKPTTQYSALSAHHLNTSAPSSATIEMTNNSNPLTFGASVDNDSLHSNKHQPGQINRMQLDLKLSYEGRTFILGRAVSSFKTLLEIINAKLKLSLEENGLRLVQKTPGMFGFQEFTLVYADKDGEQITILDDADLASLIRTCLDTQRTCIKLVLSHAAITQEGINETGQGKSLTEPLQSQSGDRLLQSANLQGRPPNQFVEVAVLKSMFSQLTENFSKLSPEFSSKITGTTVPCCECNGSGIVHMPMCVLQNGTTTQTSVPKTCDNCTGSGVRPMSKETALVLKIMDWKLRELFLEPLQIFLNRMVEGEEESHSATSSLKNIHLKFARSNNQMQLNTTAQIPFNQSFGIPRQVSANQSFNMFHTVTRNPQLQSASVEGNQMLASRTFSEGGNLAFNMSSTQLASHQIVPKPIKRDSNTDMGGYVEEPDARIPKKPNLGQLETEEIHSQINPKASWNPLSNATQKVTIASPTAAALSHSQIQPGYFPAAQYQNYRMNQGMNPTAGLVPVRDEQPTMDTPPNLGYGMQNMPVSPDPLGQNSELGSVYSGAPSPAAYGNHVGLPPGGVVATDSGPRAVANQSTFGSVVSGRKKSGMGLGDEEEAQGFGQNLNITSNSFITNPNDMSMTSNPNNWGNKKNLSMNQNSTLNVANPFLTNSMTLANAQVIGGLPVRRNSQISQQGDISGLGPSPPRGPPSLNTSLQPRGSKQLPDQQTDLNRTSPASTQPKEAYSTRKQLYFDVLREEAEPNKDGEESLPKSLVRKSDPIAAFKVSNQSQCIWKKGMLFLLSVDKFSKAEYALAEEVKHADTVEIKFDLTKLLTESGFVGNEGSNGEVSQGIRHKANLQINWKNLDDGVHYFSQKPQVLLELSA